MKTESLFRSFSKDFDSLKPFASDLLVYPEISEDVLKQIFSSIDLTSLNTTDSSCSIEAFCDKVVQFPTHFPHMPQVAAVCVYPVFASVLATKLKGTSINRTVVSAGFPSSQTFLDVKVAETKKALFLGANEVDIVISVGEFLEGNYDFVSEEISAIKSIMGDAHLKVIIESGALQSVENIWKASLLAMDAGADFIKTSTGKLSPAATLEAAWVMTHAIKAFHKSTNKQVGFKPAGGIATVEDALDYYAIQKSVLGDAWLGSDLFRIGASRLANELIDAMGHMRGEAKGESYF